MPKCCICKKDIPKGEGYQFIYISKTGKEYKKWCCNLQEKEQDERDKELYRKIQYITDEILGYKCVNNVRNKKIKELEEAGYTNEQIYRVFKKYKDEIIKWIDVNGIDKEYNKIAYMFAVVGGNIYDFSKEDEKKNDWNQYVENTIEEVDENKVDTLVEESDDDIKNRLNNNKNKSTGFADLLNKLK